MTNTQAAERQAKHECLMADAIALIEEIAEQADKSYVLGSSGHRRITLGRIYQKCDAFLARAKEQQQ